MTKIYIIEETDEYNQTYSRMNKLDLNVLVFFAIVAAIMIIAAIKESI
jgi:hypothetical protein